MKEDDMYARTQAVLDAAREFKAGFVAKKAKEIGTHDPELPDVDVSMTQLRTGRLQLFDALAALDGPLPHEQVVRATVVQETGIDA